MPLFKRHCHMIKDICMRLWVPFSWAEKKNEINVRSQSTVLVLSEKCSDLIPAHFQGRLNQIDMRSGELSRGY